MNFKNKQSKKTLYIGSVGTSSIMNTIQEAISLTDGLQTKVIYSRDQQRGQRFADSIGVKESCDNYLEMVQRDDIDIIYIASPNKLHFEQAKTALEYHKHVIIEKPVAVTEEEVRILYETAKAHDVFFFEAITTIYMPNYIAYKQLLPKLGALSDVNIVFGQYSSKYDAYLRGENPNIFNPEFQGGALNDMGIYCIHTALNLFGLPEGISYQPVLGSNGIDLAGKLTLTYSDFICNIETTKMGAAHSGCFITGENGTLIQDGSLNEFLHCCARIDNQEFSIDKQAGENRMMYEMTKFRDAIINKDHEFFEKSALQSIQASMILQKAHQNALSLN